MPPEALRDIYQIFDGEPLSGAAEPFFAQVREAAAVLGYPAFLRTGHTSAKHSWEDTCYLANPGAVPAHVIAIVEFSEMCSLRGLPCEWWAVREFLPTLPVGRCPVFGNMPVCREFRFFVKDAEVRCWHPYWPEGALKQGGIEEASDAVKSLAQCPDLDALHALAAKAGAAVGGAWSIDLLETARGWFITDMAEAEKSWHWPDCAHGS
jgi:hypothetical protein